MAPQRLQSLPVKQQACLLKHALQKRKPVRRDRTGFLWSGTIPGCEDPLTPRNLAPVIRRQISPEICSTHPCRLPQSCCPKLSAGRQHARCDQATAV